MGNNKHFRVESSYCFLNLVPSNKLRRIIVNAQMNFLICKHRPMCQCKYKKTHHQYIMYIFVVPTSLPSPTQATKIFFFLRNVC